MSYEHKNIRNVCLAIFSLFMITFYIWQGLSRNKKARITSFFFFLLCWAVAGCIVRRQPPKFRSHFLLLKVPCHNRPLNLKLWCFLSYLLFKIGYKMCNKQHKKENWPEINFDLSIMTINRSYFFRPVVLKIWFEKVTMVLCFCF